MTPSDWCYMEIRRPASHVFELIDSGTTLLKVGAILAGFGIVAALFAVALQKPAIAVLAIGLFGGAGALCLTRARRITHVLDARRGTLTIAAEPRLGKSRPTVIDQYKLGDLAAIELEAREQSDGEGNTGIVYRACYVFTNGNRRPWSQISTSNRARHEGARDAAVEFLTKTGYLSGGSTRRAAGR